MRLQLVLTVAESKRLIAKGIAAHPLVRERLARGTIAVAKGSTNACLVEELTGRKIEKPHYVTGHTLPAAADAALKSRVNASLPDLVLRDGQPVAGLSATAALAEMKEGDIFIKGANALNYALGQAAVLIGHPTGGTLGAALGIITARRIRLIVPVGLEKSVPNDLTRAAALLNAPADLDETLGALGPTLWPLPGAELFTEIEALGSLFGVDALPLAAGGIGGAEGSVRLLVEGGADDLAALKELLKQIQGEAALLG